MSEHSLHLSGGRRLALILALALLHGLIYTFLMPPWQHYDEPNHFENVWLTAHLDRLPVPGDYNPQMSRQVVESMVEHDFFRGMSGIPDLGLSGQEVHIPGRTQLIERPFYYLLASLPLRLIPSTGVVTQLYAARLVSLLLFLLTIVAAWGAVREITPPDSPLRWMVPLTLALWPGLVDLMTAVNNDAAAVMVFSWFYWGSLRLLRRGFGLLDLGWVIVSASLALWTKNTALVALFVLPLVLLLAIFRGKWRKLAWALVAVSLLVGMATTFAWGDAFAWYRATSQDIATRERSEKAVSGDHVLVIETSAAIVPAWAPPLVQPIPLDFGEQLVGNDVTLGAWMWASQPVTVTLPVLKTSSYASSGLARLSDKPAFFAFHAHMPADAWRTWVYLNPRVQGGQKVNVYYDDLVLALGSRPLDTSPRFTASDGTQGEWGGQPFTNLLRNASAETGTLRVNPRVDNLTTRVLPDKSRLSLLLEPMLDVRASRPFLVLTMRHLFHTFWAHFGWGHVPLLGRWPYRILLAVTLIGFLGALIGFWRQRRSLPWDVIAVSGAALFAAWALTLARGFVYISQPGFYVATARHAATVIVPGLMLLTYGWLQSLVGLGRLLSRRNKNAVRHGAAGQVDVPRSLLALYVIIFLALDIFSIVSIASYYGQI